MPHIMINLKKIFLLSYQNKTFPARPKSLAGIKWNKMNNKNNWKTHNNDMVL
jgi:hypothetical protein